MVFAYILGSVVIISLLSFIGVISLILKKNLLDKWLFVFIAFAVGTLFGAAFFDLLPEALEYGMENIFLYVLLGILLFFVIERFIYWHHCHDGKCDVHTFTYMNLVGDALHNFLDGVVITAAFLNSVPVGIAASVAIIFHEIPQEIGDFSILLHGGFSRAKALLFNFLVSLTSIVGALLSYFYFSLIESFVPLLLAFAAGGFIYIAGTDLFPEIKKESDIKNGLIQLIAIVIGIGLIYIL